MRFLILCFTILWAGSAYAAVENVPIKSLELSPGQAEAITVEAAQPVEIGWRTTQAKECTMNCVQALDVTGGINYTIATPLGASLKYKPVAGKITVQYKNVSDQPVSINVYQVKRTCEAEACAFVDGTKEGRWLVFKVGEF